jgi:hypothetical protein
MFFLSLLHMQVSKFLEYIIALALFVAVIGTGYIFIVSVIFKQNTFKGFYDSWQFPMLLALFIDATNGL